MNFFHFGKNKLKFENILFVFFLKSVVWKRIKIVIKIFVRENMFKNEKKAK